MIYKSVHGFVKFDMSLFLRVAPLNRNVRTAHNMRLELPHKIFGSKRSSCLSRTINIWNTLPAELVNAATPKAFSLGLLRLDKHIILPISYVND